MFLESTAAPPPRKRRVAEGGPLPPRQCGSGRPAGLRARQRLCLEILCSDVLWKTVRTVLSVRLVIIQFVKLFQALPCHTVTV